MRSISDKRGSLVDRELEADVSYRDDHRFVVIPVGISIGLDDPGKAMWTIFDTAYKTCLLGHRSYSPKFITPLVELLNEREHLIDRCWEIGRDPDVELTMVRRRFVSRDPERQPARWKAEVVALYKLLGTAQSLEPV